MYNSGLMKLGQVAREVYRICYILYGRSVVSNKPYISTIYGLYKAYLAVCHISEKKAYSSLIFGLFLQYDGCNMTKQRLHSFGMDY